ncbi:MAG: FlgD immunoglobulin-like domain containing protein [bacterium]|nr:FlgD immunoglobulin-like domain containing protein [bacterium]
MYIVNQSGATSTFDIYVYDDNSGQPGTLKSQGTFNVTTNTSGAYFSPVLSTQPVIAGDFYIFVGPQEMDAYIGICIDDGLNYDDRMGVSDNPPSWYNPGYDGDFVLRANVTYVGVEESAELALGNVELKILPNPIVNNGTISYSLKQCSKVELNIYDLSGKLVKTLDNGIQTTGTKTINWDAKDNLGNKVSSGMYFCKLRAGTNTLTKTLVVL